MKPWRNRVLIVPFVCGLTTVSIGRSPVKTQQEIKAPLQSPLIPVFATAQDDPEFEADFRNDSDQMIHIDEVYARSLIVLDGRTYTMRILKFAGNPNLGPHETWTFQLSLDAYLPEGERGKYSKALQRWRWTSTLKAGRHTLAAKVGGREFGPVSFDWKGGPLLEK